ncbi:MAG TPA: nucleoside hydrolase, partial [Lentisphaeria bacterium]|nr:nucleoside hydrolase [Lentisphaeria bacterium]
METIILDTDFETDCDDAGALCVLHALARRGNAAIAGVIASVHSPWPAAGVRALNLR